MATIGQALTSPELGYTRYEQTDSRILFTGTWVDYTDANQSGGSNKYSNTTNDYYSFKFFGTKLRLITALWEGGSRNVSVTVDDTATIIDLYNTSVIYKALVFESTELTQEVHTVVVKNLDSGQLALDCIDTDGYLVHPILNQVSDINNMEIGDVISCEYTASSGTFGTFANLGSATKDLIPVTSSATPDGAFYFIHTGYDRLGRMKLVADRNIQHNISWDKLNEAGVVGGENIISIDNEDFYMRLLSGGVSATDKDNEWDKIISEYNLNGTITAGDNNIWNWSGIGSWTSSTPTTGNIYTATRAIRGNSSVIARIDNQAPSVTSTTIGFRPLLLVRPIQISVTATSDKTYDQDVNIELDITYNIKNTDIKYRVKLNDTPQSWSDFTNEELINIEIPFTSLKYGNNIITIEVETEHGWSESVSIIYERELTILSQPMYIYHDRVTLDWLPILSPDIIDSIRLEKESSVIQNITIEGEAYEDIDIELSTTYTYKIVATKDSSSIESNVISITTPDNVAFYFKWDGEEYILKIVEGLAFADSEGDYYTTPNGIKIRPLNIGNLVGGRQSNLFGFVIENTYESENFDIELKVVRNNILAEDKGGYGLLYDAESERHRTEVTFSLDGEIYSPVYPLNTYLEAGQTKTIFMKIKPSSLTNGQETIQVLMTGRRA